VSNLGERLREEREARGLSLADVERETRIQRKFLVAIEDDRLDLLPGQAYARGFLRAYARYLDLPEQEFVGVSGTKIALTTPARIPTVIDEPLTLGASPVRWAVVGLTALLLLVTVGIIGWSAFARFRLGRDPWQTFDLPGIVAGVFGRGEAPARAPTSPPSGVAAVSPPATSEVQAPDEQTPERALPSAPPAQEPTPQLRPSPTPQPLVPPSPDPGAAAPVSEPSGIPDDGVTDSADAASSGPPAGRAPIYILGRATADVWLGVTADGRTVYAQTLASGSEMTWEASESISFRVGNAGGLDLTINDVPAGRLGASGQVIDLEYTTANLPSP
jgi:cytoskeleton protein RodZ